MTTENQTRHAHWQLYAVKGEGKSARWIEIGAAWPNRDGAGFTLKFDAMPLDGRILLRAPKPDKAENGGGQ